MTHKDRMLRGELYRAADPDLVLERDRAKSLTHLYNTSPVSMTELRKQLLGRLLGSQAAGLVIETPFTCDYGYNVHFGRDVFVNYGCVILDVNTVEIGNNVLIGPNVHIYTATHPLRADLRRQGLELGRPVVIEDDVWIGGGTIINPGVRIGARSVIGSGSVVTRDIPPDVVAAGNPCRLIRPIDQHGLTPADLHPQAQPGPS